ncbi:MAG: hypothetical protein KDH09_13420, partial [Chrysiogenetes bacterium]|nr:hypothetical protein [Chrysiogenetes bacterium]
MKAILAKWWALAALSLVVLGSGCSGTDAAIAAGATKLGFATQPPANVAAGENFTFTVELQNAAGANVPTPGVVINVTFVSPQGTIVGANGGAANSVTNSDGMATFVFSTETAQTLTFNITTPELDGISGRQVVVDPGTAVTLAYGTAPASTAVVDQAWTTFTLEARDNLGNVVTGASGNVTIGKLAMGGGAFTNATKALVSGVATFNDLSFDAIESVDLDVSTTVGTITTLPGSVNVNVQCGAAGTATQIAFGNAPAAGQTAGVAWADGSSMPVTVEVQDCFGDAVATDNSTMISASVTTGDGFTGGSTLTEPVTSGVATFDNLVYNKAEDVTLDFTTTLLPDITDVMVTVSPAAISSLSFSGAPSMSQNLESTSTMSVPVDAADAFGNPVAGENIVLSIQTNPGTGTLRATNTTVSTSAGGTATFGGVGIDKVGSGYVLRATHMATMTTADSASFNIVPGPVYSISFAMADGGKQPPASTSTDSADDFEVKVGVHDEYDNNVTDGTVMTLTRNGGTFATTPVLETDQMSDQATTTSGVATWTGVNLTKVGTGAKLRASGGSTNADSSAFNVTHGAAHHLAFGTAPTTPATDTVQWEDFTVRVLDVNDNVITSNNTNTVTVSEMSAGSFTGTTTQTLDAGVATFDDLVFNLSNPASQEAVSLTFATNIMPELIKTAVDGTSVTVETGPVPAQV